MVVTIRDVRIITTQYQQQRLVIVKLLTSEPDLYGLGCATFTQRYHAVVAALDHHIKPFVIGREVNRIEELWQMMMVSGYWRNGPVLNNAISGVDQALWDIKGKMANMPVYELFGGKCREAAHVYVHADGAVAFAKDVEPCKLFYLEDILAPEDSEYFSRIRQQCATPLAMGELFNNPREWQPLISGKLIDFIRMHVSQMGGLTPARHVTSLANHYGIRTAWHGPADTSPVGHAASLHLDLWAPNFGIQEWCRFSSHIVDMFPGLPEVRNGYMYPNDKPGLGIDVDEALAAKYPCEDL